MVNGVDSSHSGTLNYRDFTSMMLVEEGLVSIDGAYITLAKGGGGAASASKAAAKSPGATASPGGGPDQRSKMMGGMMAALAGKLAKRSVDARHGDVKKMDSERERVQAEKCAQQVKAFMAWANTKLKGTDFRFMLFEEDFRAGHLFIELISVLSKKKAPMKYTSKPRIKAQEVQNIDIGLRFIQREGLKIVNIGVDDLWCAPAAVCFGAACVGLAVPPTDRFVARAGTATSRSAWVSCGR